MSIVNIFTVLPYAWKGGGSWITSADYGICVKTTIRHSLKLPRSWALLKPCTPVTNVVPMNSLFAILLLCADIITSLLIIFYVCLRIPEFFKRNLRQSFDTAVFFVSKCHFIQYFIYICLQYISDAGDSPFLFPLGHGMI